MHKLIILYPEIFRSYEKFQRKVCNILQNMDNYAVILDRDPNEYIKNLFAINYPEVRIIPNEDWQYEEITHAIIFDDGEEFPVQKNKFIQNGTSLRLIQILITRVVNIKKEPSYKTNNNTSTYEYIGRGSYWGNPYALYENGDSREDVIRQFKYDFDYEKFPNKEKIEVHKLAGKRLGCFCKPEACHGDILADYLNAWDDGK